MCHTPFAAMFIFFIKNTNNLWHTNGSIIRENQKKEINYGKRRINTQNQTKN
jgi:hypothetical protein